MSSDHSIDGLIKWIRLKWRDQFDAVFDRHIGAICAESGIDLDDLADIIGDVSFWHLWGCAFEDFVSSGPDERNPAIAYLKRRGWKESAGTRAFIQALRDSTMSLYEVSDIIVGKSFLARDLIRGGEPVKVFERSATRSLSQWDRIAIRIVEVDGRSQIAGAFLWFDPQLAAKALRWFETAREKARTEAAEPSRLHPKPADSASAVANDEVLASSAFIFSSLWLENELRKAHDTSLPEIQNADGDPLEFMTLHFPLVSKTKHSAIRAAIDAVPEFCREQDDLWIWLEAKPGQRKVSRKGSRAGIAANAGTSVLGDIELSDRAVMLSVNSEARLIRGRAILEPVLSGLVRSPLIERETVEQMMAASPHESAQTTEDLSLSPDDLKSIIHQSLNDHYRRTLDEPIPSLGNRSPRQAVKTAKGREKVIAWVKDLENGRRKHAPDNPMASFDFSWMWDELGLADHRQ